jgi:hypothetical protein
MLIGLVHFHPRYLKFARFRQLQVNIGMEPSTQIGATTLENDVCTDANGAKLSICSLPKDHYKTISEAGKRRQRKRRERELANNEDKNKNPRSMAITRASQDRQRIELQAPSRSTATEKGDAEVTSPWDCDSLWPPPQNNLQEASERHLTLDSLRASEIMAPPPIYYIQLSGPAKRRNRRARRQRALESAVKEESHACWILYNCDHLRRMCPWNNGQSATCHVALSMMRREGCDLGSFIRFESEACGCSIFPLCPLNTEWGREKFINRRAYFGESRIWERIEKDVVDGSFLTHNEHHRRFQVSFYPVIGEEKTYKGCVHLFSHDLEIENGSTLTWLQKIKMHRKCCKIREKGIWPYQIGRARTYWMTAKFLPGSTKNAPVLELEDGQQRLDRWHKL